MCAYGAIQGTYQKDIGESLKKNLVAISTSIYILGL